MESGRFKVMVNMSSDHAGIAAELKKLEREIYRVIAHVDDPRKVRDYLQVLELRSKVWCATIGVDEHGWMDNGRYRKE